MNKMKTGMAQAVTEHLLTGNPITHLEAVTLFGVSYVHRIVSDLGNNDFFSNLAGGPSDRRFSKWYVSDLKNWLSCTFKKVSPEPPDKEEKF